MWSFNKFLQIPGEFIAQYKFTVLLMPNRLHKITGLPLEPELYYSEHSIADPDLKSILNIPGNPKADNPKAGNPKAGKKKKKKADAASDLMMEVDATAWYF